MDALNDKIVKLTPENRDEAARSAASALRQGGVIVFPTETVYGLGCLASHKDACARLARIKGRPPHKPFTVHVCSRKQIDSYWPRVSASAEKIMTKFLPGPLTCILFSELLGETVGFRWPAHDWALKLIETAGEPLFATSANLSGAASPAQVSQIDAQLIDQVDLVVDGGPTQYLKESTILDLSSSFPKLVRLGALEAGRLEDMLKSGIKQG